MAGAFFDPIKQSQSTWFPERMSDTQRMFYESVADFATGEMAEAEGALEGRDGEVARGCFRRCAALGVFSAELEERDGGLAFGIIDATLLCEALGRGHSLSVGLMVHQGVGMLPVASFGDADQRARYLPPAADGECIMAFALTEPHCGSDALALRTTARRDGAEYVLNGTKQFITNGAYAGCFVTFARVPDEGITAFLVDRDTPGLTVGPEEEKLGQHASSTCSVYYEDVRLSDSQVLGAPGQGHKIALNMLNLGRLKLAAASVGKMKELLPQAVAYVKERQAFGRFLIEFGMVRDRLARMASLLFAVESAVYRVADAMEQAVNDGREAATPLSGAERLAVLQAFAFECALVKSLATESLGSFSDDMLQLYGGYGFSEEYPAAKAFRDGRVTRLYEGTTEICRLTMMQRLLGAVGDRGPGLRSELGGIFGQKDVVRTMLLGVEANEVHEQGITGPLMAICERIYAAESALLRAGGTDDKTAYYVASVISENLSDFHRIAGNLAPSDWSTLRGELLFPTADNRGLRDRLVAGLQVGVGL